MPVIAGMAAVAIASGLMQYYNSEKARGAQQDQLDKIKDMFDKIVPPDYNIKVWDDPALVANIPAPKFNEATLTPEEYKSVGQYVPQVAQFVQEQAPQLIKASGVGQEAQQAQLSALDRYKQIAQGEFDPQFAQLQQQASDRARQDAQGRIASTLEAANRRGQLDSGVQVAAQLQGGSDAMQRQAIESQQAATDAYKNRLAATSAQASLGGQIYGQDIALQGANTNIINDFNQRTSKEYQTWLNNRASQANQASIYNLDNAQRISDANVANANAYAKYNQQNQNQLAQQDFANQNLNRQNQIDVELTKDKLKGQQYSDLLTKTNGQAGIASNQINMIGSNARDQNQAFQGIGGGVSSAMMYGDYANREDEKLDLQKQRLALAQGQSQTSSPVYTGSSIGYAPSSQTDGTIGQTPYVRPYTAASDDLNGYDDWLRQRQGA